MAYFRGNTRVVGESRLLSANADGTDEKMLLVQNSALPSQYLSWAPDGEKIAYALRLGQAGPEAMGGVGVFDFVSGKSSRLATFATKMVYELHWLPNGRGLVVVYGAKPRIFQRQIGYIVYPGGEFRTIARDTNSYRTLTLSEDGSTAATVQIKTAHTIDLIPGSGSKESSPPPVLSEVPDAFALSWAGDKELLLSNGSELIQVSMDGTNRRTLASDAAGNINSAQRCGEQYWSSRGRFMAAAMERESGG